MSMIASFFDGLLVPTRNDIYRLTLPDLTPNCGFWWYFFTEMFDHFRPFFLMVFTVTPYLTFQIISDD